MKLLTVAIPAYNIEKYIAMALDSVLDQRIEAIVINDGSTDSTEQIALDYQQKYPDIIRVITKENGGWGSGINLAIKEAKGEYFTNLDSDDWYNSDGLKKVLDNMEKHKVDLLIAPGIEHSMLDDKEWPIQFPSSCIYDKEVPFDNLINSTDFFFTIHSLFYKTSILQENNISIDECYYTDVEFISYPLPYVSTVYVQTEPVYVYRVDRNGQSISVESIAKHVDDMILVARNVCDWYLKQPAYRKAYYSKIACSAVYGYITYPFAIETDRQGTYINGLRSFKQTVLSADDYLSNPDNYGIFAKIVLNNNFNKYALVGMCWRFFMKHRKLSAAIWQIIR